MNNKIINEIIKVVEQGKRFLITAHINPEGDSLGSQLGLYHCLKQLNKDVCILNADPVPPNYRFLPGSKQIEILPANTKAAKLKEVSPRPVGNRCKAPNFDAIFVLDCSAAYRSGDVEDYIKKNKTGQRKGTVVNIDHHHDNDYFGDINWVDPGASSAGEMIFCLSKAMGLELTRKKAVCLYTAILTDTGSFNYSNTSSETYKIAGRLVEAGVQPKDIAVKVYQRRSAASVRLLGYALSGLELSNSGRLGWIKVTPQMLKKAGAAEKDTEDFVNYPRTISTVEAAVFFRQIAGDDYIRVNFRSKNKVDVSKVARKFGGGGHARASGCKIKAGDLDAVITKVIKEIRKYL